MNDSSVVPGLGAILLVIQKRLPHTHPQADYAFKKKNEARFILFCGMNSLSKSRLENKASEKILLKKAECQSMVTLTGENTASGKSLVFCKKQIVNHTL